MGREEGETNWDPGERDAADAVPVVGLVPRDNMNSLRLPNLNPVLPSELDGRLVRFRSAGEKDGVRESSGLVAHEDFAECFCGLVHVVRSVKEERRKAYGVREARGVVVGERAELSCDRVDYALVTVPNTGYCCSCTRVQNAAPETSAR